MIFISVFAGIAIAVFLVCITYDLKPQEAAGVTALVLTIVKTGWDFWEKANQYREKLQLKMGLSFVTEGMPKGQKKDYIQITVTVRNPCEFQIPIKSVEYQGCRHG